MQLNINKYPMNNILYIIYILIYNLFKKTKCWSNVPVMKCDLTLSLVSFRIQL